ncbi:TssQ family T6SS-associated lipoprotein [Pusillimonas noertemannii]|uniref:TssQ family T6SS-associated lipoprotein n=1 Tax=Pusillimonas noertemannii TaxID=305977 RepID=UPI0002E448C7|nr:TssQ family T6SS-associated lipoprotein [Pusillimonas noertemannii]
MNSTLRLLAATLGGLLLASCAHQAGIGAQPATPAQEQALAEIRTAYEAGRYAQVAQQVGLSADLQTAPRDMHIEALKLQAFSYCLLDDARRCERSFSRLAARYPDYELPESERRHPMWGPVYEKTKAPNR